MSFVTQHLSNIVCIYMVGQIQPTPDLIGASDSNHEVIILEVHYCPKQPSLFQQFV